MMDPLKITRILSAYSEVCNALGEPNNSLRYSAMLVDETLEMLREDVVRAVHADEPLTIGSSNEEMILGLLSTIRENTDSSRQTYQSQIESWVVQLEDLARTQGLSTPDQAAIKRLSLLANLDDINTDTLVAEFETIILMVLEDTRDGITSRERVSNAHKMQIELVRVLLDKDETDIAAASMRGSLDRLSPEHHRLFQDQPHIDHTLGTVQSLIRRFKNNPSSSNDTATSPVVSFKSDHRYAPEGNAAYFSGDQAEAIRLHMLGAENGEQDSQLSMGTYYQLGLGCDVDMEKAREYYQAAVNQGNLAAMQYLGALKQMGLGGPIDYEAAYQLYRRAGIQGYVPSLGNLAAMLTSNLISVYSLAGAVECHIRAYENGDLESLNKAFVIFSNPAESFEH